MKLASLLSDVAQICRPGSDCFKNATSRFVTGWAAPNFDVIVEVATPEDVQTLVRYANDNYKPFLAISGKHGDTSSLGNVKNGIGIYMKQMDDVSIAEDGKSATVGGGITSSKLIDHLWPRGKQSVIGACECTGLVAPMLGGGHDFLKGRYGLLADNLISANMVLANGSAITVSESQHPDLFWAIRGAGHNFGVVTSFQYKIYDRAPENELWAYDSMVVSIDKLETVYEEAEKQRQGAPVELGHWGSTLVLPDVDPKVHSLLFTVFYQGSELPSKYRDPFHKIEPLVSNPGVTEFPGFAKVVGLDSSPPVCQTGGPSYQVFPANLESYNTNALRQAVGIIQSTPPELHSSSLLIEGYSDQAVRAVPENSTAFPDRKRGISMGALINYPRNRTDLADEARSFGVRAQKALAGGGDGKLHSYVNYAAGNEPREAIYGYESWRLEKLRLKEEYDPHGRFNFYLPVEGTVCKESIDYTGDKSEL